MRPKAFPPLNLPNHWNPGSLPKIRTWVWCTSQPFTTQSKSGEQRGTGGTKFCRAPWLLASLSLSKNKPPGDAPDVWWSLSPVVPLPPQRAHQWGKAIEIRNRVCQEPHHTEHPSRHKSRDDGHWVIWFLGGHQTPPSLHFGVHSSLKIVSNPSLTFLPFQSTFVSIHHLATKKSINEQRL